MFVLSVSGLGLCDENFPLLMCFDLHVNPLLVIDQGRIGFEGSSTIRTEVGLQFRMHRDLVDSQSCLSRKLFLTLVTREGLLACKEEFL